jgi:hypothetical protein
MGLPACRFCGFDTLPDGWTHVAKASDRHVIYARGVEFEVGCTVSQDRCGLLFTWVVRQRSNGAQASGAAGSAWSALRLAVDAHDGWARRNAPVPPFTRGFGEGLETVEAPF